MLTGHESSCKDRTATYVLRTDTSSPPRTPVKGIVVPRHTTTTFVKLSDVSYIYLTLIQEPVTMATANPKLDNNTSFE